jgi:hypothetical protein
MGSRQNSYAPGAKKTPVGSRKNSVVGAGVLSPGNKMPAGSRRGSAAVA